MADIKVRPGDLARVLRERLKSDAGLVRRASLDAAHFGVAMAVKRTNEVGAVDSGHFKRSWKVDRDSRGASVLNDAPYASNIEFGRLPGSPPPFAPILQWVMRKLDVEPEAAYDVAKAIQMSIGRRGIPPKFILRSIRPALGKQFLKEIMKRLNAGR